MTENYRALAALLVLSIPVLLFLRAPLTAAAIAPSDFRLRAGLWVGLTVMLFVVQGFWLFMSVATLTLLVLGRTDSNRLGLYFFLLLVAPPFESAIQGFAGINYFLSLDYLRLLSFVVLLPAALRLVRDPAAPGPFKMPADKYLAAYLALLLIIEFPISSTTNQLRSSLSYGVDIVLPYYVCSRWLIDRRRLRDAMASFAAACAVMALVAVFETFKGWLLYASLPNFLNVRWSYGNYMMRDGALRATVSAGHSIVFGYVMTVALGLHLALRSSFPTAKSWWCVAFLLFAGIAASMSRGPWIGAAAMIAVAFMLGAGTGERVAKTSLAAIFVVPVLMLTSLGPKIISLLPFVGNVDAANVEYRQQLFNVSWSVLMLNPVFGSPYYMSNPLMEQMRQGEGIIDMVNSYLGVAMVSGFVGLAFFVGVFASTVGRLWLHLVRHADKSSDDYATGRALLAALVGILVIIATASSINAIPVIYWCVAGMCAAYLHTSKVEIVSHPRTAVRGRAGRPAAQA